MRTALCLLLLLVGCAPVESDALPDLSLDAAAPDALLDAAPDAEPDAEPDAAPEPLAVGTFNIDWLADHYESEFTPRLAADYAMIAQLIVETDVEVFGLQEIDGPGALELLALPPRYRWVVGRSGWSQNLAILYRSDRVQVSDVREIRLPDTDFPSKDPLVAQVDSLEGDLMFTLVVVHFKPFTNTEDATYRAHQISALHQWLSAGLPEAPPPRPPVIIVGDFNDTHEGLHRTLDPLQPFEDDPGWVFVEDACPGGTQTRYESRIDHLVVSHALEPRVIGPIGGPSCVVDRFDERPPYRDYPGGYRGRSNISTHRPLWMWIALEPGLDPPEGDPR